MKEKVIKDLHGSRFAGHFGRDKITTSFEERLYWPKLEKDVITIVSCPVYQVAKG